MHAAQIESIDDIETLRRIAMKNASLLVQREGEIEAHRALLAERDARIAAFGRTIVYKDAKIDALTLEVARLKRLEYGAKSERFDPGQKTLFEESKGEDLGAAEAQLDALRAEVDADRDTPAQPRNIPQRRPLPPALPRVEVRHEPASCTCGSCGGALHPIGEQVSEKLDLEPLKFFVRRDVYPQYACRACETITAAPVAPAIIDRGIAAPGLLAQVVIGKYVDHLPLYRQEAMFERAGLAIPRNVQAEWIGRIGVALAPLAAGLGLTPRGAATWRYRKRCWTN